MGVGRFFVLVLAISVPSEAESSHSKRLGQEKRFFLPDVVNQFVDPKYKREECILCKCYQECHSEQFHISETDLCKPYVDQINCHEVDRCTCCKDLLRFNACENGGKCHNRGHGNFTCDCPPGHYGQRCESSGSTGTHTNTNYCTTNPCKNGATCTNGANSYTCRCQPGWTGTNCEIDRDECSSNQPCKNSATCINTQGGYRCQYKPGWTGDQCDLDACHIKQCGTNGVCQHQETFPFYNCNCTNGHFGLHCELHACDIKPCHNDGSCVSVNVIPYFRCLCKTGFTGDTCEVAPVLPKWTGWFYGACSVSCGNGTVARIRKCSTGHDEDCAGVAMETTTCSEKPC